jgi:hypothetical protein
MTDREDRERESEQTEDTRYERVLGEEEQERERLADDLRGAPLPEEETER